MSTGWKTIPHCRRHRVRRRTIRRGNTKVRPPGPFPHRSRPDPWRRDFERERISRSVEESTRLLVLPRGVRVILEIPSVSRSRTTYSCPSQWTRRGRGTQGRRCTPVIQGICPTTERGRRKVSRGTTGPAQTLPVFPRGST